MRGATRSFSIIPAYTCSSRATRASRLASRKTRLDRWNLNVTRDPRLLFTYVSITFASSGWLFRIVFARWRKSREAFNLTLFFSFLEASQWNSIYFLRGANNNRWKIFCSKVCSFILNHIQIIDDAIYRLLDLILKLSC